MNDRSKYGTFISAGEQVFDLARAMELAYKDVKQKKNPKGDQNQSVRLFMTDGDPSSYIANIQARYLDSGQFSIVFRDDQGVLIAIDETSLCGEKTKAFLAWMNREFGEQPFIPYVQRIGYTFSGGKWYTLYRSPFYKVPLEQRGVAWKMYKAFREMLDEAVTTTATFKTEQWSIESRNMMLDLLSQSRQKAPKDVDEATWGAFIDMASLLISESLKWDNGWIMEAPPRNVGTDGNGQLILLDIFYDAIAIDRKSSGEC